MCVRHYPRPQVTKMRKIQALSSKSWQSREWDRFGKANIPQCQKSPDREGMMLREQRGKRDCHH